MPFGLPVVPEVYSVNSRSSASFSRGGQVSETWAISSWYQWSRPSTTLNGVSRPSRLTSSTFSTLGEPSSASSEICLSGTTPPRR